mgnify:FL=1|tara:strand:+ start:339 stop:788 length:450 start_codon:yes stop_codon:yes gene_type:complete
MAIFISTKAQFSQRNNLVNHNFKVELRVMKDADTHLQEIKDRVLAFAKERDWEQFHAPKNLSMAIAAEAAELMEHFLWQSPEASCSDMEAENLRSKVEEELADVFIFAIEFANMTGIDIATIIDTKMKRNAEKYPVEKAKGRSVKYTEL